MLIRAILTTVLIGTSAVAMAQTYEPTPYPGDGYGRVELRRGRLMRKQFVIADNVRLTADREPRLIRIDPRLRLSRLRLELERGRAYVDSVLIAFADGHQEAVAVNQMIGPRNPRLVVDLPGAGPRRDIIGVAIRTTQQHAYARGGGYRYMRPAHVRVIGVRGW